MFDGYKGAGYKRGFMRRRTHIGFFIFAGLILGALLGEWIAASPGPGALAGAGLGLGLGYLADRLQKARSR